MIEVEATETFNNWFDGLVDRRNKFKVTTQIDRIKLGNLADHKSVGDGVLEIRMHGPGYRLYLSKRGESYVLLLAGGDKSTQAADIAKAKELRASLLP